MKKARKAFKTWMLMNDFKAEITNVDMHGNMIQLIGFAKAYAKREEDALRKVVCETVITELSKDAETFQLFQRNDLVIQATDSEMKDKRFIDLFVDAVVSVAAGKVKIFEMKCIPEVEDKFNANAGNLHNVLPDAVDVSWFVKNDGKYLTLMTGMFAFSEDN